MNWSGKDVLLHFWAGRGNNENCDCGKLFCVNLGREKLQAPQLLFGVSNLAPVSRETSCGTSRLENRAAIHQQKNFGQR